LIAGSPNQQFYFHYDGLGNIIALSDAKGDIAESYRYVEDPLFLRRGEDPPFVRRNVFGEPSNTSSLGNSYLFTGRYYDAETGLYYYRARVYHLFSFVMLNTFVYDCITENG
jgi:uncharacterized protein RhaS with RHS repeats